MEKIMTAGIVELPPSTSPSEDVPYVDELTEGLFQVSRIQMIAPAVASAALEGERIFRAYQLKDYDSIPGRLYDIRGKNNALASVAFEDPCLLLAALHAYNEYGTNMTIDKRGAAKIMIDELQLLIDSQKLFASK